MNKDDLMLELKIDRRSLAKKLNSMYDYLITMIVEKDCISLIDSEGCTRYELNSKK